MTTNTDHEILNQALSHIGARHVPSFDAPGPAQTIPGDVYVSIRDDLLSKYPWTFTKKFGELVRKGEPDNHWSDAFLLPHDQLEVPRAFYGSANDKRPLTRFEIIGNTVCANSDKLFALYQHRSHPDHWPQYFVHLLRMALKAEFAGCIREDWALQKSLRREVYGDDQAQGEGGQFAVAMNLDAQRSGAEEIDGGFNPLTASRYTDDDEETFVLRMD